MCETCEALREEVAYLRMVLAERIDETRAHALQGAFGLKPVATRVLMVLYQSRGLFVENDTIEEAIGHAGVDSNLVRVYCTRIRVALGDPGAVINLRGRGYRLSDTARAKVAQALIEVDRIGQEAVNSGPIRHAIA